MLYGILADLLVLTHLCFVAFVVLGGLLALRWRWVPWLHVPMALWGVAIELGGWICPLTPLENGRRRAAGVAEYAGGFLEHYLLPVLYPAELSRPIQLALGTSVLILNAAIYTLLWRRRRRR